MTDTPKDGDLGTTAAGHFVKHCDGDWYYGTGRVANPDMDAITPMGERATPIETCEAVAEFLRFGTGLVGHWRAAADILDPPTPEPPRFREGDVVAYGDSEYLYVVNADGVPCSYVVNADGVPRSRNGAATTYPLDSDRWRVIGTFTPKEDA